jgi:hypothetical protein
MIETRASTQMVRDLERVEDQVLALTSNEEAYHAIGQVCLFENLVKP